MSVGFDPRADGVEDASRANSAALDGSRANRVAPDSSPANGGAADGSRANSVAPDVSPADGGAADGSRANADTADPAGFLKPGERLDDLQCAGLKLIQRPDAFRFGTDSVLLADFAAPRRSDMAVDLGCGTGAIALLMAGHQPALRVDAVELQPDIADMARRSVVLNGLEPRVRVHCADMRQIWRQLGAGRRTLVVCNPPYGRSGAALESLSETRRIARHEGDLTPGDVARAAAMLLKNGGRFCAVYPAPRAYELMRAMDDNRIAPKRVRTVHGVEGRAPKFVLLEGVKLGGEGLHWLEPLVLRHADGSFTDEWRRIYGAE